MRCRWRVDSTRCWCRSNVLYLIDEADFFVACGFIEAEVDVQCLV